MVSHVSPQAVDFLASTVRLVVELEIEKAQASPMDEQSIGDRYFIVHQSIPVPITAVSGRMYVAFALAEAESPDLDTGERLAIPSDTLTEFGRYLQSLGQGLESLGE